MNLRIRQVFINQDNKLDPGCVPYSSVGRKPKLYENQHILDLINQGDHLGSDYWGLTSWRMESKSGLSHEKLKTKIEENKGYDVYLYNDWGADFSLLHNKNLPVSKIVRRLYEIRAIPFENKHLDWVSVFLNFWVAKPYIVERYVGFLRSVVSAMETDPVIVEILEKETYRHRGEQCPLHPFVLEYMFGLFLFHYPDIKFFRVPNITSKVEAKFDVGRKMEIFYSIPWSSNKNIAEYYNNFMENLPSGDSFACFIDGDAMFTTNNFGKQLEDIVKKYPDCGIFTSVTNRIGNPSQVIGDPYTNDMLHHRCVGQSIQKEKYDHVTDITMGQLMSGVVIMISKRTWKKIGGFRGEGMLGVDNAIHFDARCRGEKVYRMDGVYVYHWYRNGNKSDTKHLKK